MGGRQGEARRNDVRVLDAACAVFGELGCEAPVSAIAKRAGVGMGSLYRRYPTKDRLLYEACLAGLGRIADAVEQAAGQGDAWEGLRQVLAEALDGGAVSLYRMCPPTAELRAAASKVKCALDDVIARTPGLRPGVTAADLLRLAAVDDRYLDVVLHGLRGDEPLPGAGPDWVTD